MDLVCLDANDTEWRFNSAESRYYRMKKGEIWSKIDGKHLPDPDVLWNKKIEIYKKRGERVNVDALKSTPAVYALWNHWKSHKYTT